MGVLRMGKEERTEFLSMFIPVFVEQLAIAGIAMLISALVKGLGMEAVAAVNLLNSLTILFQQVFTAVGVGITVVIAQYRGIGNNTATGHAAGQSITLSVYLSLAIGVLFFVFMGPALNFILSDSDPLVYQYSRTYLTYNLIALPFFAVYTVCAASIRGSGQPQRSLIATLIYNGMYALFASLTVALTKTGLHGIGISMVISAVLAAAYGIRLVRKGNDAMRVEKFTFKLDMNVMRPVFRIGIPLVLENALFQCGKLATQTFSVAYGTNSMAANGICNNISQLMLVPGMAASNAAPAIVGKYCGRMDNDGAMRKGWQFIFLTSIMVVVTCAAFYTFLWPLCRMMSDVVAVQQEVHYVMSVACLVKPFTWTLAFVTPAILRSSGDAKFTTIVSVVAMFTMRVGVAYLLAVVMKIGIIGIWIGMYSDWVLRVICFYPRFTKRIWLRFRLLDEE